MIENYIKTKEKQRVIYRKYKDEFNSIRDVIEMYEYMLDMCDCEKEKAFENLDKWILTKNKEIIKDYLDLISLEIEEEKYQYILEKFGIY